MAALKIETALTTAKEKLTSLGLEPVLVSEIEWCFGSYESDQNAEGLYEKGEAALVALEKFKVKNPRKVSKKLIEDLSKAVKAK